MAKISKFVLVAPGSFYVRKVTYTCTGCGQSFKLELESAPEELLTLEREHVCQVQAPKTNTSAFPLVKLLRQQQGPKKH